MMVSAVFVLGFSSILTGLNFIVTVHKMRVPGLDWFKMPLFVWGMYATSIIQVMATPVLAITLALLAMERTLGIGFFDPKLGGDPRFIPTLLLVLLPSSCIYYDFTWNGGYFRNHRDVL
jgi:cytochrome c oxidase subunit 1